MGEENLVWDVDPIDAGADAPRKAHFLWRKGTVPVRAAAFSLLELHAEIEKRKAARLEVTELRRAYECLAAPAVRSR